MNKNEWRNQIWILEMLYPRDIKKNVCFFIVCSIILLAIIFCYQYPIYQTFYGMVCQDKQNVIKVMVPFSKIDEFESAVIRNKDMKLVSVDNEPEFISGEKVINAEVIVSISQKLLVENNIVVLRVKTKDMSIWKEFSQKWKKGVKNEASRK
ncbi:MAG: hypothetical protein HFH08_03810 [Bacilli bacterium]|nr:hypothetical protein [Bacilli bacterium]